MKTSAITILVASLIGLVGIGGFAKAARAGKIHAPFAISMTDFSDMVKDMEDSDRLSNEDNFPSSQVSKLIRVEVD